MSVCGCYVASTLTSGNMSSLIRIAFTLCYGNRMTSWREGSFPSRWDTAAHDHFRAYFLSTIFMLAMLLCSCFAILCIGLIFAYWRYPCIWTEESLSQKWFKKKKKNARNKGSHSVLSIHSTTSKRCGGLKLTYVTIEKKKGGLQTGKFLRLGRVSKGSEDERSKGLKLW